MRVGAATLPLAVTEVPRLARLPVHFGRPRQWQSRTVRPLHRTSAPHDACDLDSVVDVVERVGIEDHEIRIHARGKRADPKLAAMIMALHAAAQEQLPITMVGAGLPQLLGQMGDAKSYAERLFEFVHVDKLDRTSAIEAITVPAARQGVEYEESALDEILEHTSGYPYFL